MPHVIRLRGPWDYEPLARLVSLPDGRVCATTEDLPPSGVMELPGDWSGSLGAEFQGCVRFTRRFHRPTGLETASHVWLAIDDVDWQGEVALNDHSLGTVVCSQSVERLHSLRCPARFDVTRLLLPQNLLSIVVSSPGLDADGFPLTRSGRTGQPRGLVGLVRLEID